MQPKMDENFQEFLFCRETKFNMMLIYKTLSSSFHHFSPFSCKMLLPTINSVFLHKTLIHLKNVVKNILSTAKFALNSGKN